MHHLNSFSFCLPNLLRHVSEIYLFLNKPARCCHRDLLARVRVLWIISSEDPSPFPLSLRRHYGRTEGSTNSDMFLGNHPGLQSYVRELEEDSVVLTNRQLLRELRFKSGVLDKQKEGT
jgi:hypothetical protein